MKFQISRHAQEQLAERGIAIELINSVMAAPEQIVPDSRKGVVYQSKFVGENGRTYLLRIFVDNSINPVVIKTLYITTKIDKYWRKS